MEPIQLPSKAEIRATFQLGEDASIAVFFTALSRLAERVQHLEDQIARNSGSSSKPLSYNGLKKKPKSLWHKRDEKRVGQPGHTEHSLKAGAQPICIFTTGKNGQGAMALTRSPFVPP